MRYCVRSPLPAPLLLLPSPTDDQTARSRIIFSTDSAASLHKRNNRITNCPKDTKQNNYIKQQNTPKIAVRYSLAWLPTLHLELLEKAEVHQDSHKT